MEAYFRLPDGKQSFSPFDGECQETPIGVFVVSKFRLKWIRDGSQLAWQPNFLRQLFQEFPRITCRIVPQNLLNMGRSAAWSSSSEESFASGVDVLFDFGIVQHIPWTWITSVNGVLVFDKVRLTKNRWRCLSPPKTRLKGGEWFESQHESSWQENWRHKQIYGIVSQTVFVCVVRTWLIYLKFCYQIMGRMIV